VAPARAHIQNRIRALRFHHGEMTQRELALRIGVTRQTVNAIEGSKYSPSLEVAFRIAEVFGVPLGEVFQHVVPGRPGAPDEPGDAGGEARRGP
jgi:putative transcriptional regulator